MNGRRIDDEELAAFADGRLNERERADVLARLEASDDDYEDFLDAVALLAEFDAEDAAAGLAPVPAPHAGAPQVAAAPVDAPRADAGATERAVAERDAPERLTAESDAAGPGWASAPPLHVVPRGGGERLDLPPEPEPRADPAVVPLHARRKPVWRRPVWLAAAAVIAAAALTPLLWRGAEPAGMGQAADLLTAPHAGLEPLWTEQRPWRTTLGGEDPMTDRGRAVRLGATHADLEVALAAGDTATAAQLAREAAALLEPVPGGGFAAAAYTSLARNPATALGGADAAAQNASAVLGPEHAALGAWAEAARIAAERQDAAFFRSGRTRAALERITALPGLSDEGRAAASALSGATASASPDWRAVQASADDLLAELAR